MEKRDRSPEKNSSEEDRRREVSRQLPNAGDSGGDNLSDRVEESRHLTRPTAEMMRSPLPPPTRPTIEMIRSSFPMMITSPPRPRPLPFRPTGEMMRSSFPMVTPFSFRPPLIVNSGTGSGKLPGWMQEEGSGIKRNRDTNPGDMTSSSNIVEPKLKKKGEMTDPPKRQPCCATCGKYFGSWKALFGHLRSHPDREYRGAFPPPKALDGDAPAENSRSGLVRRIDPRQQQVIISSLINAATTVSSMLTDDDGGKEKAKDSEVAPSNRDETRRSLRNDGLELDLNVPPAPNPDSEEEDEK